MLQNMRSASQHWLGKIVLSIVFTFLIAVLDVVLCLLLPGGVLFLRGPLFGLVVPRLFLGVLINGLVRAVVLFLDLRIEGVGLATLEARRR